MAKCQPASLSGSRLLQLCLSATQHCNTAQKFTRRPQAGHSMEQILNPPPTPIRTPAILLCVFFLSTYPKAKWCNYINICSLSLFCVSLGWTLLCKLMRQCQGEHWVSLHTSEATGELELVLRASQTLWPTQKKCLELFTCIKSWFSKRDHHAVEV